jgi:hypothetical protein
MRAADTNVVVRLLLRDDAPQAEAADSFVDRGAWISILALAETVWVLESVYDDLRASLPMRLTCCSRMIAWLSTKQRPRKRRCALSARSLRSVSQTA